MSRFLDALDHPIVFVFFVTLAVLGMAALILTGASKLGISQYVPAAASGNPA